MPAREIPGSGYNRETQVKIINTATKLFAFKDFDSVSLRDIAEEVGIKLSSIQYYYRKKEDLWKDVLLYFESNYRHYFTWLTEENKQTNSLNELMDNFFNTEFVEMHDPMGCFGMSIIIKNQHSNELAKKLFFDLFYDYSIKSMQMDMDQLIEKGMLPPTDTKSIAMILIFGVIVINDIRLHNYMGMNPPLDCSNMFKSLRSIGEILLSTPQIGTTHG